MAYELKQVLKLGQNLVMTPQLQQAIRLLQMSRLDLIETVREELEENPVLEEGAAPSEGQAADSGGRDEMELNWQRYLAESGDNGPGAGVFGSRGDAEEYDVFRNIASAAGGLREHLLRQLHVRTVPEWQRTLAEFIIGNIDDDGYLRLVEREGLEDGPLEEAVLEEVSRCTGRTTEEVGEALGLVQSLDPPGVGARTARECLLIQARLLPERNAVVEGIIENHLRTFAARNTRAIARALSVGEDEVREAARLITTLLNPTPGAGFGAATPRHIVPDVYIRKVGDEYVITLNDDGMPKLRISSRYREMLTGGGPGVDGEDRKYLQERLRSAMWLIKSLHQRQRTIYRVVECIVDFQRDFLERGLEYLRPLVLKDVAAILGVHESTVSRVTSNKYVDTPRGLFELKYFFTNSLPSADGGDVTSEYIKSKIREIVGGEDGSHPLSDQDIAARLGALGMKVARRTVAKYREALGIPPSNRRRACF